MNALFSSEVSGCHEQINGATVFYSLPHDTETSFRKGQNALHVIAKIGQHCIKNLHGSNDTTLNAIAKQHAPKNHKTSNEK